MAQDSFAGFAALLEILASDATIRGKVRVQKLAFLSQRKMKGRIDFGFKPAPLGPLSVTINNMLEKLTQINMVEETVDSTASGNIVYCYSITSHGKEFLKSLKNGGVISSEDVCAIASTCKRYKGMPYFKLLNFIHEKYPKYHLKDITL